ncbi:MAG: A/G-specific adenine glycosylase [Anaerolineales bacterium]
MISSFSQKLLNWYQSNARRLPWRNNPQPYSVWISEIMLQQTKVETVIPYYLRWMERFPDIPSLAQASQEEVLKIWEGLGYYARARNLHRTAQIIQEEYAGKLPENPEQLRALPGIGAYTAHAIASIAFHQDLPTLDGNITRVLARILALDIPIRNKEAQKKLLEFAQHNLPSGKAGDFNQALMELGALICLPRKPNCHQCPIFSECQAQKLGLEEKVPIKSVQNHIPHFTVTAGVIRREQQVLLAQRPPKGLLGGLWEFPGGKVEVGETLEACLSRELREELGLEVMIEHFIGAYQHAYTHFRVTVHAFSCHPLPFQNPKPMLQQPILWVDIPQLPNFPMGKIDRQIAQYLIKEKSC